MKLSKPSETNRKSKSIADQIEPWPISRLKPYDRNARTHTDEDVAKVAGSIRRFGFTIPLLVDETGEIIAGHCRLRAAQLLKLDAVPVIVARGWSAEEKAAYCITDNQLSARAGWDFDLLRQELERLQANQFELADLGFETVDLAKLLAPSGGQTDPEDVPAVAAVVITQPGDTWLLGPHRVHCGDSTDAKAVTAAFGPHSPVLMVTDPPYGVHYDPSWRTRTGLTGAAAARTSTGRVLNDDRADWRDAYAHFPGAVAYIWHGGMHAGVVADGLIACGLIPRAQIIWAKQHFAMSRGDYHWQHETCWYAVREGKRSNWTGDRKQTTVWEIANNNPFGNQAAETTFGHGTQKPIECMRRPILNNSRPGDCIYDGFLGVGTTLISAEMTGRICVGLELAPAYVDVIVKRWQAFTGKAALLERTGQSFAARSASLLRRPRKSSSKG